MSVNRSMSRRSLFCIAAAGMIGACLCAAQVQAGKDVFQRTKPHANIGTISSPQGGAKDGARVRGQFVRPPAEKGGPTLAVAMPDLRIREFRFVPGHPKAVRVRVVNTGAAAAAKNRLRLTVRRIDGVPAGRMEFAVVPVLAAGKDAWIVIDADSILPNAVKLQATTFRLDVDATKVVSESNESNNLEWHNL